MSQTNICGKQVPTVPYEAPGRRAYACFLWRGFSVVHCYLIKMGGKIRPMAIRSSEKVIQISSGTIVKAVLIVLAIAAFYYLRDILLVVVLAVIIASAVEPGTKWFLRRGVPRNLS